MPLINYTEKLLETSTDLAFDDIDEFKDLNIWLKTPPLDFKEYTV